MDTKPDGFLSATRLLRGPWASLERDVARLMNLNGFESVRLVGGSGDGGADILGVKGGEIWSVQCKHTTTTPPPRAAIGEVVAAGAVYRAQRLLIACSRQPTDTFLDEVRAINAAGTRLDVLGPGDLLAYMRAAPQYPHSRKPLRDYQSAAVAQLEAALNETGKGLVVLATGLGKTVVMAELVAHLFDSEQLPSGRVLVLAHTRDIVSQVHQAS